MFSFSYKIFNVYKWAENINVYFSKKYCFYGDSFYTAHIILDFLILNFLIPNYHSIRTKIRLQLFLSRRIHKILISGVYFWTKVLESSEFYFGN